MQHFLPPISSLFLIVIFSGRILANDIAAAENLIPNGGFEDSDAPSQGQFPPDWPKETHTASLSVIKLEAPSRPESPGKLCLKINTSNILSNAGLSCSPIPVDSNQSYNLSGWIKASGDLPDSAGAYVGITWIDASNKPISNQLNANGEPVTIYYVMYSYQSDEWQYFTTTFIPTLDSENPKSNEIPADAAYLEIKLMVVSYPMPAYFDDLILTAE